MLVQSIVWQLTSHTVLTLIGFDTSRSVLQQLVSVLSVQVAIVTAQFEGRYNLTL